MLVMSCTFEAPKAPSWDVALLIPIISQTQTVEEMLRDRVGVFDYRDGLLGLRVEGEIQELRVVDYLKPDVVDQVVQSQVPNLTIGRLTADIVSFPFSSLTEQAASPSSMPVKIAPFAFSNIKGKLKPEDDLESIQVIEGSARLIYHNRLPVDLEEVVFYLFEPSTMEIKLITPIIRRIPAGKKDSLQLSLINKSLTRLGEWYISGTCPGSKGQSVLLSSENEVELIVDFVDFRVSSVQGRRQSFYMEDEQIIDLGIDAALQEGLLKNGRCSMNIRNTLDLDLDLTIRSPELVNPVDNRPLTILTRVAANRERTILRSLAGYKLVLGSAPVKPPVVHIQIEAEGRTQGDELVTVSETDAILMEFHLDELSFQSLRGCLDRYRAAIEPAEAPVRLPEQLRDFAGLNLNDGRIRLDFTNSIQMPIRLEGEVTGKTENGRQATVPLVYEIPKGSANEPQSVTCVIDAGENPAVLTLLNLLPRSVCFGGTAVIGDGRASGVLNADSYLKARYILETPADLAWQKTTLAEDSLEIVVHPQGDKLPPARSGTLHLDAEKTNPLQSMTLIAEVENHLPVSGSVTFSCVDACEEIPLEAVIIPSAQTNNQGRAVAVGKKRVQIALPDEIVKKFHNEGNTIRSFKMRSKMIVDGTGGRRVKMFQGDYLAVQAAIEARVRVGGN